MEPANLKQAAMAFYDLMFNRCRPADAVERFDIFRFDGEGRIVERWDVLQVIPAESRNDNGMF